MYSYEDFKLIKELNSEKLTDILAKGPTEQDIIDKNVTSKLINLEVLKMGDLFPSYYCINNLHLDINYEADSPCELITIKLSDLQEVINVFFIFIFRNQSSLLKLMQSLIQMMNLLENFFIIILYGIIISIL